MYSFMLKTTDRFIKIVESGNTFPLKEKEIEVILKRLSKESLEEIGKEYGCTRERVRQIEMAGLSKLYYDMETLLKKYGDFRVMENNRFLLNGTEMILGAELIMGELQLTFRIQKNQKNLNIEQFVEFMTKQIDEQNQLRRLLGKETGIPFKIECN